MKKLSLVLMMVLFAVSTILAQRTVSGTVTDDAGDPLIGANVLVKGTASGVATDLDGKYSVSVPEGSKVIVFSYTGFETLEVELSASNVLDVTMSEGVIITEVVVTAIGIERKKDDDLSSATLINPDDIARSGETGVIQGLAGKTSGLQITRNSGDPGAGAYIQIRGQNTILGDASPLIILDGVPISNTSADLGDDTNGVSQQSRLNDIAAGDIESVTVLKGASAAAVYGTGAANGVIVIKTKRGKTGGKRFSVNVSASYGFDEVNREYKKQGTFGQGFHAPWVGGAYSDFGVWVGNTGFSWGDRIADRSGTNVVDETGAYFEGNQSGTKHYPITEKGDQTVYNDVNRDQVFQTGSTADMSVGINYSGDNSNTFFSFSRTDQDGIFRGNSNFKRNTFRINNSFSLLKNLDIRINGSYTGTSSDRIQKGSNLAGLYLGYLRTSPDFDNTDYDGLYYNAAGIASNAHRSYRRYLGDVAPIYNNPGWTINRQENTNKVDRFIIAPEVNWTLMDGVMLTARYGLDYYTDERNTFFPKNSAGDFANGSFARDDIKEKTQNFFLFLNGEKSLTEQLNLGWTLGYNIYDNQYERNSGSVNNLLLDDPTKLIYNNASGSDQLPDIFTSHNRKNGGFLVLNADYDNKIFFETSGRVERTASVEDETFFFPSVSLGYKFAEDPSKLMSFGKLRVSYGEIGIEPSLYVNRDVFFNTTSGGEGWGDVLDGVNYNGTFRRGSIQGNPDLTIERVKEFEIGADMRFLRDRLSVGLTYYDRLTEDAILPIEVPPSTGYTNIYANAAEISNKGIEVDLSYRLFASKDFSWRAFANFSRNKNIVEKLPEVSRYILNGFTSTSSAVVEGEPFGAIYGGRWLLDDNGNQVLDDNGFPLADPDQGVIGDPNPDWRGGIGSEFGYKGVTLSFLFETSQGNDMWAGTAGVLHYFGIHEETANISTATQDLPTLYGDIIPAGTEFRGNIADFGGGPVALDADWYTDTGGGFGPVGEQFVVDASWVRLREVSLGYSFKPSLLKDLGMSSLEVGVTGRNLILWTEFEGVDPDLNLTGASKGRGLDYFTNPGTRSILFNVKFGF